MKFKAFLLASTVAVLAASGANAADAIVEEPAPVVVAPVFSWSGAYIGGQVGYGWAKSKASGDLVGSVSPDGFLGGLYAGYNFETGNGFVLGVDGDVTYNDQSKHSGLYVDDVAVGNVKTDLRWSGAVRARAGYAVDRFLPYIAGGVAFGQVKNTIDVGSAWASESKTHTGWTLGAGVDYAATDNVILRLEYRYTDYGKKDYNFDTSYNTENKFKTNEVRLGVAYKF